MDPYRVVDLAGLDISFATRQRHADTRNSRDIVLLWANRLYHLGRLGQKTGRGYNLYPDGQRTGQPDPEIEALIADARAVVDVTPRAVSEAEIQRHCMAAMVNEAARIVGDGIARQPLDVDVTLLYGYGFPGYRCGPLKWADMTGLAGLFGVF